VAQRFITTLPGGSIKGSATQFPGHSEVLGTHDSEERRQAQVHHHGQGQPVLVRRIQGLVQRQEDQASLRCKGHDQHPLFVSFSIVNSWSNQPSYGIFAPPRNSTSSISMPPDGGSIRNPTIVPCQPGTALKSTSAVRHSPLPCKGTCTDSSAE